MRSGRIYSVCSEEQVMRGLIHQPAGQKTIPGPSKALAKVENQRSNIEIKFRLSLFPGTLPTDKPDKVTVLDCEIIFALCGY
jgi:hypothetical protein